MMKIVLTISICNDWKILGENKKIKSFYFCSSQCLGMGSQIFFLSHFYQEKYTCKIFLFSVSLTFNLYIFHLFLILIPRSPCLDLSKPKPQSFLILPTLSTCIFIQPPKFPWRCSVFDISLLLSFLPTSIYWTLNMWQPLFCKLKIQP